MKEDIQSNELSESEILWNSAGMHRPIASFWYNYIFLLIAAVPGLLVVGYLIPSVLMPNPSALGIGTIVTTYFQFLFVMFDMGTGLAIERFMAEHAVNNPKRAIKYLSFFTWFQFFTGALQTTIVAVYVLTVIRAGGNAFLSWPFLIYSLTTYPGMLGVYKHALAAFQQHDKEIIVTLFQNVLFQSLTQIGFILLGRYWGARNPFMGEMMGAALGFIVGSYVDDFVGMILGAYFFSQVLRPLNLRMRDTLIPSFSKDLAKEVIIYGAKIVPAYAIEAGVQFLILSITMVWLPNYTTIVAIVTLASSVATITSIAFTITPAISEAYNNGYEKLTQYYIKQQWKHWALIAMFLFVIVYMIVPSAFRALAGDYALAAEILGLLLITRILVFPINFGSSVSQGIDKPEYQTYALIFEQSFRLFTYFAFLNPWWGLVTVIGANWALYLYIFADFPAFCVKLVVQWWLVKRVLKFSIAPSFFQTFVSPLLTAIPLVLITIIPVRIFEYYIALSDDLVIPIVILGITLIAALFLYPIFILFPAYGFFGGWDDKGLDDFKKAASITGPSRFLVNLMAKTTEWGHKISPFKNKFPIPYEEAQKEADILTERRLLLYQQEELEKEQN